MRRQLLAIAGSLLAALALGAGGAQALVLKTGAGEHYGIAPVPGSAPSAPGFAPVTSSAPCLDPALPG
jgi:hypothetical protein